MLTSCIYDVAMQHTSKILYDMNALKDCFIRIAQMHVFASLNSKRSIIDNIDKQNCVGINITNKMLVYLLPCPISNVLHCIIYIIYQILHIFTI